jgi:hypothetical protein
LVARRLQRPIELLDYEVEPAQRLLLELLQGLAVLVPELFDDARPA